MPKTHQLSKADLRQLKAIKKDSNLHTNLDSFRNSLKGPTMTYKQIHAKWYYLNTTKKKRGKSKAPSVPVRRIHKGVQTSAIKPYVLEKGVIVTARGDQQLREQVMQKMRPSLLAMGVRTHTLPIYRADQKAFRELVKEKDFAGMVFGTTKIPDNPKMLRVYRKM